MQNTKEPSSIGAEFPGPDFEVKVRAAAAAEVDASTRLTTLRKKIQTVEANRSLLELDNRDPEAELRVLRASARTAEGEIQLSRQATQRLFSDERERYTELRNELWVAINSEVIAPHLIALRELSARITAAIAVVIALIGAPEEATMPSPLRTAIDAFDAGTAAFNSLAKELNAHAQIFVPANEFLYVITSETLARNVRQNVNTKKIEEALKLASSPQRAR